MPFDDASAKADQAPSPGPSAFHLEGVARVARPAVDSSPAGPLGSGDAGQLTTPTSPQTAAPPRVMTDGPAAPPSNASAVPSSSSFDFDVMDSKGKLMTAFERLEELSPSTRDRIRPRIWAHLNELPAVGIFEDSKDLDAYLLIACILSAFVLAPILALLWSSGQSWPLRAAAILVAELSVFSVLLAFSEFGVGRFARHTLYSDSAVLLVIVALLVMAIRSLPQMVQGAHPWLAEGLRAGYWSGVILPLGIAIIFFAQPLLARWNQDWSRQPEANVVANLLEALRHFESLVQFERQRSEAILANIAVQQRRRDSVTEIQNRERIAHLNVSTATTRRADGSDLEVYELRATRTSGGPDIVIAEERILREHSDEERQALRRRMAWSIEKAAGYIHWGLPARLRVGPAEIDEWMQLEMRGRAQAVRDWARQIVLPSPKERAQLLAQMANAIEHAAEENWGALLKAELKPDVGLRERVLVALRKASVAIVPLVVVLVAPRSGFNLPLPVRDSLLTFAIPWLLLQLLQLAAPDAGEILSRSKDLRGMLPKF